MGTDILKGPRQFSARIQGPGILCILSSFIGSEHDKLIEQYTGCTAETGDR